MRRVFVHFSGPYRNVGDSLIRRRGLVWARDLGAVHVLLGGRQSEDWANSLSIDTRDHVYSAPFQWIKEALIAPGERPVLLIEPGEFNTDRRFAKALAVLFVLSVVFRLRGGTVVQLPRSVSRASRLGSLSYRLTLGSRPVALWREEPSWKRFHEVGSVVPDIGFDDPDSGNRPGVDRDTIVISMRIDREPLPAHVLQWLVAYAERNRSTLVAVSQVEEDNSRTLDLARQLKASAVPWLHESSLEQEVAMRSLYEKARLVLSDRLHVLVLASLHGAAPLELVQSPNGKIARHFAAIGLRDISHDVASLDSEERMVAILDAGAAGAPTVASAVESARKKLADHRRSLNERVHVR